eukprot:1569772-Amphidinium_carterae.1
MSTIELLSLGCASLPFGPIRSRQRNRLAESSSMHVAFVRKTFTPNQHIQGVALGTDTKNSEF